MYGDEASNLVDFYFLFGKKRKFLLHLADEPGHTARTASFAYYGVAYSRVWAEHATERSRSRGEARKHGGNMRGMRKGERGKRGTARR